MGWQGRDPSTDFRLLFCYMSWGLLVYLLYYLLVRYLILNALKSFYLIQRSWIYLFGEFVVLCKDVLSKILNFIWQKKNSFFSFLPNGPKSLWASLKTQHRSLSLTCYYAFTNPTCPFIVSDVFPTSVEKTRRKASCLGISLCCSWCKYHIYDHANAWSRCLWVAKPFMCTVLHINIPYWLQYSNIRASFLWWLFNYRKEN